MKIKVFIGTSLDGFIARSDGDIGWLERFADGDAVKAYEEFTSTVDAFVIGRGTFEKVLRFPSWPYEKHVFVLSTSLTKVPEKAWPEVTVLSMEPGALLHYLAGKGYSVIYVDGGKVIQEFLKADLIDEMIISRVPVLIGSGIPLFGHLDNDLHFRHVRTHTSSNGLVRSHYERIR